MSNLDLFNQIFLEKKDYRKIRILSKFQKNPHESFKIKELYKNYQASRKTLHSDIDELEKDLIEVYNKPILKRKIDGSYFLDTDFRFSIQKLLIFYAENSRDFWVFNKIFKDHTKPLKKLTENLFYSQSAIYNSMYRLNQQFQSLPISWMLSGIGGEERIIRHLLFESYWYLFGGVSWPFDSSRESLMDDVREFEVKGCVFNELERERLLYWLSITKIRINNGSIIATDNHVLRENKETVIPYKLFLEKHCFEKYQMTDFKEEINFFINTLIHFIGYSEFKMNEEKKSLGSEIEKIEEKIRQKGLEDGWTDTLLQQFDNKLKKISYYWTENLLGWYHFLEPRAAIYFKESKYFLENDMKILLKEIPLSLGIAYMYECKKVNLFFVSPVRIQIISKEGSSIEVEKLIQQFSEYPVEFDQKKGAEVDILLTNFLEKQGRKDINRIRSFFFDWPLNKSKVSAILEQAIALKKISK